MYQVINDTAKLVQMGIDRENQWSRIDAEFLDRETLGQETLTEFLDREKWITFR